MIFHQTSRFCISTKTFYSSVSLSIVTSARLKSVVWSSSLREEDSEEVSDDEVSHRFYVWTTYLASSSCCLVNSCWCSYSIISKLLACRAAAECALVFSVWIVATYISTYLMPLSMFFRSGPTIANTCFSVITWFYVGSPSFTLSISSNSLSFGSFSTARALEVM